MNMFEAFLLERMGANPYKFDWKRVSGGYAPKFIATAKTKDGDDLVFEIHREYPTSDYWAFSFAINDSLRMTGKGDQFRILSTAMEVLDKFLDEWRPTILEIRAGGMPGGRNRMRPYKRMLERFLRNSLHGEIYELDEDRMMDMIFLRLKDEDWDD